MFTFFTIVFAIVWAVVSFILLFKVWDNIGPIVLSFSKSHIVQLLAMRSSSSSFGAFPAGFG